MLGCGAQNFYLYGPLEFVGEIILGLHMCIQGNIFHCTHSQMVFFRILYLSLSFGYCSAPACMSWESLGGLESQVWMLYSQEHSVAAPS